MSVRRPLNSRKRRLRSLMMRTRAENGCIEWVGSIGANGYGQYRTEDVNLTVHRMLWLTFLGEIPEGFQIHHTCGNRRCVDPLHLDLIEHAEHVRHHAPHEARWGTR